MIGVGVWCAVPALGVGMLLGWRRHRRALASAWAHRSTVTVTEEAPYRRSEQRLPVPGAERRVVWRLAFVSAMALVALGRVPLAWDAIVNLVDLGHVETGLVPADARSVVLVAALALHGAVLAILVTRAADALARRTERAPSRARAARIAALLGSALAWTSAAILWRATSKPPIYWVAGFLSDDVAYGLLCLATARTLGVLARMHEETPCVAAAPAESPRRLRRALEVLVVLLAAGTVTQAVVTAQRGVRFHRELRGEIAISIADATARRSEDRRYTVWMPEDGGSYHAKHATPFGEVEAEKRHVWRKDAHLGLTAYERLPVDVRTVDDLCREERDAIRGTVVAWSIRREEDPTSCEVVARIAEGQHLVRRVYVAGRRLYELEAAPVPSPAADMFLRSFTLHDAR